MTPLLTPLILIHPHTHAGKSYGTGERLEVDAGTAEWLLVHDVAARDTTTPAKPARTEIPLSSTHRKESKP